MKKVGDLASGCLLAGLGIGTVIGSVRIGLGAPGNPHPGFFPFVGGLLLSIFSGALLLKAWAGRTTGTEPFANLWRPAAVVIGLIIYVLIVEAVGYIIAIIILSGIALRVLRTSAWELALFSTGLAIGSYVLFDLLLGVPLPAGILAGIL